MEQAAAAVSLPVSDRNAYHLTSYSLQGQKNMQSSSSLLKSYIDSEPIA